MFLVFIIKSKVLILLPPMVLLSPITSKLLNYMFLDVTALQPTVEESNSLTLLKAIEFSSLQLKGWHFL
jgi:hypothetical protein